MSRPIWSPFVLLLLLSSAHAGSTVVFTVFDFAGEANAQALAAVTNRFRYELSRNAGVGVVSRRRMLSHRQANQPLSSRGIGSYIEVARQLGSHYVVVGNLTQRRADSELSINIYDVRSGARVGSFSRTCNASDVRTLMHNLIARAAEAVPHYLTFDDGASSLLEVNNEFGRGVIYIDGQERGSPKFVALNLPCGTHTVEVQVEDTVVDSREVTTQPGRATRVYMGSRDLYFSIVPSVTVHQGVHESRSWYGTATKYPYSSLGPKMALRIRARRNLFGLEGGYLGLGNSDGAGGFLTYHFETLRAFRMLSLAVGVKAGLWYSDSEFFFSGFSTLIGVGASRMKIELEYALLLGTELTNMMNIGFAVEVPMGQGD